MYNKEYLFFRFYSFGTSFWYEETLKFVPYWTLLNTFNVLWIFVDSFCIYYQRNFYVNHLKLNAKICKIIGRKSSKIYQSFLESSQRITLDEDRSRRNHAWSSRQVRSWYGRWRYWGRSYCSLHWRVIRLLVLVL